jgi:hypothetical protein
MSLIQSATQPTEASNRSASGTVSNTMAQGARLGLPQNSPLMKFPHRPKANAMGAGMMMRSATSR